MSGKQTINTADYIAVMNALSEYCQALDEQNEASLSALFADDAKITVALIDREFKGASGVKEFLTMVKGKYKAGAMHHESNVMIGNNNNWFTNLSYWQCVSDGVIISYGKHEDLLKVTDGIAKFVSRKIIHSWTKPTPAAKNNNNNNNTNVATNASDSNGVGDSSAKSGRRRRRGGRGGRGRGGAANDDDVNAAAPAPAPVAASPANNGAAPANGGGRRAARKQLLDPAVSLFVTGFDKSDQEGVLAAVKTLFSTHGTVSEIIWRGVNVFVVFAQPAPSAAALAAFTATPPKIGDRPLVVERVRERPVVNGASTTSTTAAAAVASK
jgi:hypothetical protein